MTVYDGGFKYMEEHLFLQQSLALLNADAPDQGIWAPQEGRRFSKKFAMRSECGRLALSATPVLAFNVTARLSKAQGTNLPGLYLSADASCTSGLRKGTIRG